MLEYRKPEGEKEGNETTIKTKQGEENSQGRRQKTENTVFANQKLKAQACYTPEDVPKI